MTIITQNEIINTIQVDEHFSVNNIKDAQILKCELLLANEFLGESLYSAIVSDKTDTGTFSTSKYQTLYDNYLKTLLSEYIILSLTTQKVLELSNTSLNETGASQLKALARYKEAMQDEVNKSKRLLNSYLTNKVRSSDFTDYLGNNKKSTTSETTKRNIVFGFLTRHNN